LAGRRPDVAADVGARLEQLAAALPDHVPIDQVEHAEVELRALDDAIAAAMLESFGDEAAHARTAAAAMLKPFGAMMPAAAFDTTLRQHTAEQLRHELGVPLVATFYLVES